MLPKSNATEYLLHLHKVLKEASPAAFQSWPMPTKGDYSLIGEFTVQFSYIDLSLRRIIEVWDHSGELPEKWRGKSASLTMADVEMMIRTRPDWSKPNAAALERIDLLRGYRNLLAHFAIRRFPNDDAFLFVTKSKKDFRREFDKDPDPGMVMTGIMEVNAMRIGLRELRGLQKWLYAATDEIEDRYLKSKTNVSV